MPAVSVIVPCFNEQKTIALLLEAIYNQTYPRADLEVILADGVSTDGTRAAVVAFQTSHPQLCVRLVDNPRRTIPAALNIALRSSQAEFVVRLDAHAVPDAHYIERCIAALKEGRGENVGGVWQIEPGGATWVARAIAAAAGHPLGVGDAMYRLAAKAGPVDTVPFGAFRRSLVERIGPFDESLLTNEDYEFNTRIRQSGGTVWLDPAIHTIYFARSNLAALSRQYARYGFWKYRMLQRYPGTLRWRQALPPLFVLSLAVLFLIGLFWPAALALLGVELILYALVLLAVGAASGAKKGQPAFVIGLPLAIAVMHFSWGGGFLVSMVKSLVK